MDKWVDLHTNNKFSLLVVDFHNRSLLSATYGSGFRVSAGLSLFPFIIIILSRLLFWLFFFFGRARGRGISSPTQSLTNRIFITLSFETSHYNINTSFFRRIELGRREWEERKKLFRWGVEIIC